LHQQQIESKKKKITSLIKSRLKSFQEDYKTLAYTYEII